MTNEQIETLVQCGREASFGITIYPDTWSGVVYDPTREAQVHESLQLLKRFHQDMKNLVNAWWNNFPASANNMQVDIDKILYSTVLGRNINSERWIRAAVTEADAFIKYILWYFSNELENPGWAEIADAINSEKIKNLVGGFLKSHVGENDHTVIPPRGNRDGLDGHERTCPVAKVPYIAVVYFSYFAATYIQMRKIMQLVKSES